MHCELFSSEHRRNGLELADGNSPLRRVLAAPGGDAGLLACGAPANSNVLAGFLAGRSTGRRPVSPISLCENLKVVSFAVNLRATMAIWAVGVGALPRPPLGGPPESHSRLSSPFSGIPAVSVFRQAGRPARGRVRPAAVIRAGAGIRGPRRGLIGTARICGRPPRSDLICRAGRRGHQLPDISSPIALK